MSPIARLCSVTAGVAVAILFSVGVGRMMSPVHAKGQDKYSSLGVGAAVIGDMDGDGLRDFAVGGRLRGDPEPERHVFVLVSGRDMAELGVLGSERPMEAEVESTLEWSLAECEDSDGDARRDVAVVWSGAVKKRPGGGICEGVTVYSTKTLKALRSTILREYKNEELGGLWLSPENVTDFDGDGLADILAGNPRAANGSMRMAGEVMGVSGKDLSIVFRRKGESEGLGFGTSATISRSKDGRFDGRLIIGSPFAATKGGEEIGMVSLVSLKGAKETVVATGSQHHEYFGGSMAGLGDVDGDGVEDVAVGAPSFINGVLPDCGRVALVSVGRGKVLFEIRGDEADGRLGCALAGLGDIDGDGVGDFVAGAPGVSAREVGPGATKRDVSGVGQVLIVSGKDGRILRTVRDEPVMGTGGLFGHAICRAPDMDGDGKSDVLVGAPSAMRWPGRRFEGKVVVVSSVTGKVLLRFPAK